MSKKVRQTPKSDKLNKNSARNNKRKRNCELRTREYLSTTEVEQLRKAARSNGRYGHRNDALILLMFRHALRVSEAINLRWEQVDFKHCLLHVRRIKNGVPSTQPLRNVELRALRKLRRDCLDTPYMFVSERKAPLTARAVQYIIASAGKAAALPFPVHPHMLRHSTGFYLANKGYDTRAIQSYMGHANIKNTVIYTELSAGRFNDFWSD